MADKLQLVGLFAGIITSCYFFAKSLLCGILVYAYVGSAQELADGFRGIKRSYPLVQSLACLLVALGLTYICW